VNVSLALLAEAANASADGKLNILGVFDTVLAEAFPAVHLRCVLVLRFRPEPADAGTTQRLEIRFQDVDGGTPIWGIQSQFDVAPGVTRGNIDNVLVLQGIPLAHEGEFEFTIAIEGEIKERVPLFARRSPGDQ
jgi:hypothetical protein